MRYKSLRYFLTLLAIALSLPSWSQWAAHRSVLADHTWYKIGVTADGVYGLDYASLQTWGIDVQQLNPSRIRMFGNVQGTLAESNAGGRYDDLTEMAIQVTGADDGSFDEGDRILFYGQGPVRLTWTSDNFYLYDRNPYSDTVYYFLCVDAEENGLRIEDRTGASTEASTPRITMFPDCYYHESDEFSPYASGRVWFGDLFTRLDGPKVFQMSFPGLVATKEVYMDMRVMGRSKPESSFHVSLNDEILVHQSIDKYGEYEYGKMYSLSQWASLHTENANLCYEFDPGEGNPMLFIDYFAFTFWQQLRYRGRQMGFRIVPSQLQAGVSKVEIDGSGAFTVCWDVTDPLHPFRQLVELQNGGVFFGVEGHAERCCHLFDTDDLKSVASCRNIPNQNLHGLEDAELLIITPRIFWEQAEALVSFHVEHDGMDCAIADVNEIYNEFSTGMMDPTALRDMIRMLYLRSEGHLKYVLLLGKGTHDYRNLKGIDNNFVPTYENAYNPCSETGSMCSDDYFALMDEDEGANCDGKVDLGVGRIPITTPEQGDAVIRKIQHYVDLEAMHGDWKNNHLVMADNDAKIYATYAETVCDIVDTLWPVAMVKKLYLDSYPVVSTPNGNRAPLAHQALMDYFEKGVHVLSYMGHGGIKNLSGEWVLALSDILSLSNYDRLPLIHTATCEFSKFDKPDVVSGGELLLLNPNGGAIALLTTTRPTQAITNQPMSKSVSRHLYEKQDGQSLRFGDFYRIVKSDPEFYKKGNIVYVLMGDPALRMSYPTHTVKTEQASGSELITVKGCILNPEGGFDSQFNGVLDVRLYDQKSQFTTLGQFADPISYSYYNDVLFEGRASVTGGRFELVVPLPASVSQGEGMPRLSYYAYDSIRKVDANGIYEDFQLNVPSGVTDNQGPEIHLYWNTPEFESGDVVSPSGTLYADFYDEHGIYHYNVSIGRDIVMKSNVSGFENKIVNDRYEPALNDYRRGRVSIPLGELGDGKYEFSLKAWDTWNNPTEVEIVMVVERNTLLAQVQSFPNPFDGEVFFSFIDGEMTEDLDVQLEIFDMMGRRVAMMEEHTASVAGEVPVIRWDGRGDGGYVLRPGVYTYRLNVTDPSGKTRTLSHRLVKK
jgi:hypothetical protein